MLLDLLHLTPCARGTSTPVDVDWDALLTYVGTSLAPLVLRGIGSRTDAVPPTVLATLVARRDLLARTRLLVAAIVGSAGRSLTAAGVPFIVLKGAALATTVYPDPVLRPMSDIDLWVPDDRIGDALDAMTAVGFHDSARSELQAPAASETREWRLARPGAPLEIELHTRLPSLEGLPWAGFADAWRAGRDADLGGFRARVLGADHQLVHAALHLSRRNLFTTGLSHLVDVARIVAHERDGWDWPRMQRDWHAQGIAEWMHLTLVLARDLLGAPVPPLIGEPEAGEEWRTMRALAEEQLWEGRAHRLPAAVQRTARFRTPAELAAWLRWRLFDHYWRSSEPRPAGRILTDGLRRLWHDLTVKVPVYVRGWREGTLRGRRLAHGRALEVRRGELERLVSARSGRGPAELR